MENIFYKLVAVDNYGNEAFEIGYFNDLIKAKKIANYYKYNNEEEMKYLKPMIFTINTEDDVFDFDDCKVGMFAIRKDDRFLILRKDEIMDFTCCNEEDMEELISTYNFDNCISVEIETFNGNILYTEVPLRSDEEEMRKEAAKKFMKHINC